jgi:hypothetical protein
VNITKEEKYRRFRKLRRFYVDFLRRYPIFWDLMMHLSNIETLSKQKGYIKEYNKKYYYKNRDKILLNKKIKSFR